jgi:hypothetical protein
MVLALMLVLPASCGGGGEEKELTVSLFDPESGNFFDVPFPSEVHRNPDGSIDLSNFPNPRRSPWIGKLITAASEDCSGFGTNSAVYFRFSGPIRTSTLPASPEASASPGSSVLLVNLDHDSEGFGERIPLHTFFREEVGFMWLPDTLVLLPAQGFALEGDTLYGAVITDDLKDADGRDILRDEGFSALVDDTPGDGPLYSDMEALHRTAMADLEDLGVAGPAIINMALFRTMDPVAQMRLVARKIYDEVEDPQVADITLAEQTDDYYLFEGHYGPNPVFQHGWSTGLFPYETEGGQFTFDGTGQPVIDGEETLTFALAVPKTHMPVPGGYPVLLYAHGTGGDYRSFVDDETAGRMARLGVAAFGIDNAMNGTRIPPDKSADLLFFNVINMRAGRDNNRQGAADVIQQERMAAALSIDAGSSPTGEEIHLDGSKILFMGHSQGGLNGSLYLALSERCLGGYLSGSAGNILYSIAYKTSPINILVTIGIMVGLAGDEAEKSDLGIYHPLINLIQMFIEPSDPINYARHWFHRPLEGIPPRSIFQIEGMGDTYAPPAGIEALGAAAEIPPVSPMISLVEGFELKGLLPIDRPVSGNIATAEGRVTAGFSQYEPPAGVDGHFVSFHNDEAAETWTWFLYTLAGGGEPEIR